MIEHLQAKVHEVLAVGAVRLVVLTGTTGSRTACSETLPEETGCTAPLTEG